MEDMRVTNVIIMEDFSLLYVSFQNYYTKSEETFEHRLLGILQDLLLVQLLDINHGVDNRLDSGFGCNRTTWTRVTMWT